MQAGGSARKAKSGGGKEAAKGMAVQGAAGIEGKLRAGAAGTDDISRGHPRGRNERVNCGEQQGDVDEEEQNSGEEEDEGARDDGKSSKKQEATGRCMHCKKAEGLTGALMKLYRCGCGNEFHHVCAGKLGHEDMSSCKECAD